MSKSTQTKKVPAVIILIVIILITTLSIACVVPGLATGSDPALEQTRIAIGVEQTSIALQHTADAQSQSQPVGNPEEGVPPTYTPLPTYTPYPTAEPQQPTPEPQQPTAEPATLEPAMSMEERIRGSNVLIWEDIVGDPLNAGDRRVSDAVNQIGFSGGKVINVSDAMGDFKAHLLSGTAWDLIIISAEVRSSIQGEFWEYMLDQLNRGVAMIAEVWYLDDTANGKIAPVLSRCGISLQKDWVRNPGYNQLDYSILTLAPEHPVFNTPNSGVSLVTPNIYWMYDAGDFIELGTGGDAQMLAGLYYSHKSDYGVMAECMGGRVIFQTFSTHDYRYDQTVPLWVNYINYTLTNHYQAIGQ